MPASTAAAKTAPPGQRRPSRPSPPRPTAFGYAESLAKQVGMTGALGDPDDTELVDMSARYRALSQRPISTNSAIWVLLIRLRMLCSSRWVIPGLAEGVTGMDGGPAGSRRQPVFGGCRHRVKNGRR
jgi:hypothetical protein